MRRRKYIFALIALWGGIYLFNSPYPPALLDDADTVHAEAAREMAETNNWVTLHANGIRYLEKAPLMYWSIALSYKLLGVSEFASRLPVALATLGLIIATFMIGKHFFGDRAGFYSGLIIASCVGIFLFTRVLWPDVMLTLFISMAFYCFLRAREDGPARSGYTYGIYVFGALGVLTKGLVGAAFPAIIIVAYLAITGEIRRLFHYKLFTGTLLFLSIAAPWHVATGMSNPGDLMEGTPHPSQGRGFFWFYFMNEHFLRYLGRRYPADYDTVPLPLFLALHLVWLFPWSLFLPLVVRDIPRRLKGLSREGGVALFLLLWAALIILFFSFSTTQEYYTMPAYPAFALLIGQALSKREIEAREAAGGRLLAGTQVALAATGTVVFLAGAFAFIQTRNIPVEGDISTTLTRNPEAYALSLGHVLDLTPQTLAALQVPVVGTALSFLLGTASALFLRRGRKHVASSISLALMMAAFFFFARLSLAAFEPYLSSRALAASIDREYKDGDVIVINGEYEGGSSINFYTRKTVHILNGRSANLEYGSYFKDAPRIFLNTDDLARVWSGPGRVYLFTDSYQADKVTASLAGPVYRLAESGGKFILTNRQSN
ncbi:MAG TPA: glycosyltransferase family 39 protein [Blastocatellia bacterium]|jgi:4-amino-4-deoxy-L-arabinose transferase-like glycosyltransferase|nr:glycosyltransferase family 39 protein [Blastocatellia bacterium]